MASSLCESEKERVSKEVDLFIIPHSRMKQLVKETSRKVFTADFSDDSAVGSLLISLNQTFLEFKHHEEIENRYIMDKLKSRVTKSELLELLANMHHNTHVKDILTLVKRAVQHELRDTFQRSLLKHELQKAIREFIDDFVPHMREEEEVFQPLLSIYFTRNELEHLHQKIVYLHTLTSEVDEEDDSEDQSCEVVGAEFKTSISVLPNELLLQIFSQLSPKDLCHCSQVSRKWSKIACDGLLWQELYPVRWIFRNDWRTGLDIYEECPCNDESSNNSSSGQDSMDDDDSEEEIDQRKFGVDNNQENNVKRLMLMARYLIPMVGDHVKVLILCCCPALTNGLVHKMLSYCKNLQFIDLSQTSISDLGLNGLFRKNGGRHLKHVDLSGCAKITDKTLKKLSTALGKAGNCTSRRSSCSSSSDEQTDGSNGDFITAKQPGLTYLSLSGCYQITDDGLRILAKYGNLKKLLHLDLSGCLQLSAKGLQDFVPACPSLQHESLFYCDNIAEGPFPDTASGCQNLECTQRVCCRRMLEQFILRIHCSYRTAKIMLNEQYCSTSMITYCQTEHDEITALFTAMNFVSEAGVHVLTTAFYSTSLFEHIEKSVRHIEPILF